MQKDCIQLLQIKSEQKDEAEQDFTSEELLAALKWRGKNILMASLLNFKIFWASL